MELVSSLLGMSFQVRTIPLELSEKSLFKEKARRCAAALF